MYRNPLALHAVDSTNQETISVKNMTFDKVYDFQSIIDVLDAIVLKAVKMVKNTLNHLITVVSLDTSNEPSMDAEKSSAKEL